MNQPSLSPFQEARIDSLPFVIGFIPFAMVLGAQAHTMGMATWEVPMMTGLNFAGGSEFAAVALWATVPPTLLIMLTTLMINSRHILMGAVLTPYIKDAPKWKQYLSLFLMCDEVWALGVQHTRKYRLEKLDFAYYFSVAAILWTTWSCSAIVGALIGPLMGDPYLWGIDMTFVATFIILLRGMWEGFSQARPWAVSFLVALLTYKFIGGQWHLILGPAAGLILAYYLELKRCDTE